MKKVLFGVLSVLLLVACDKESGEGGTSVVSGKVLMIDPLGHYDPLEQKYDTTEYYTEKEDVYIIYGADANAVYDDSFETSWDGTYRFEFLRKGEYTLFVYSDCDSCVSGKMPVFQYVNIEENNKAYTLPDFVIYK